MSNVDIFSNFPTRIRANLEPSSLSYVQLPAHFAIHGPVPAHLSPSILGYINNQSIAILRGNVASDITHDSSIRITPVYALEPNSVPAVPTGRIFVRFKENVQAEEKREALAAIGYQIIEIPAYAPHAAWVGVYPDGIGVSLSNITLLQSISDVLNIEPQMLTKLGYRSHSDKSKGL